MCPVQPRAHPHRTHPLLDLEKLVGCGLRPGWVRVPVVRQQLHARRGTAVHLPRPSLPADPTSRPQAEDRHPCRVRSKGGDV